MPKFKQIEKVLNHLIEFKPSKKQRFYMRFYIAPLDSRGEIERDIYSKATVGEIRNNTCGTAFCLGGDAVIQLAPKNAVINFSDGGDCTVDGLCVDQAAAGLLGLDEVEARYMFGGEWTNTDIHDIRKQQAVSYLKRVIKERTVFIKLGRKAPLTESEINDL